MRKFLYSMIIMLGFVFLYHTEPASVWGAPYESEGGWEDETTDPWEEKADFSNAALSQTTFSYTVFKQCAWDSTTGEFVGEIIILNAINPEYLSEDEYSYSVEQAGIKLTDLWITGDVIHFTAEGMGSAKVNLIIQGKVFPFTIQASLIQLKGNSSLLLKKGKIKKLSLSGTTGKVSWKSSNSKIVSVSSSGKVKAKKEGNVVITAHVNGGKIGCVISVVTAKRYRAIKEAIKIGKTCKYSQAKRMKKGYYDCSAAVWKAYKKAGMVFGSKYYAPTAADNAKWCVKHKKKVKGNVVTNTFKMKYTVGSLFYSVGMTKGRYKKIGHVEMLAGYEFIGFDESGKACVSPVWAINNGYIGKDGLVCDPLK
ncbi:MAG: Ig-like domain-containing protein [Eubacterium sp.]|nr:Ig-like domain-containing protein [Eubacterium sp.]